MTIPPTGCFDLDVPPKNLRDATTLAFYKGLPFFVIRQNVFRDVIEGGVIVRNGTTVGETPEGIIAAAQYLCVLRLVDLFDGGCFFIHAGRQMGDRVTSATG